MMPPNALASLFWFVVILAMIPVALWLLKRTPLGGGSMAHGVVRSIGALPLSGSQRIVTVEVGSGESRRWLVLGVTPQSITTLHTMAPEQDAPLAPLAPAPQTAPNGFARLLGRLRRPTDGAAGER